MKYIMTILRKILKAQYITDQDDVESHLCNEWGYMSINVDYLKKHMESFHDGVCYQCDYRANMSHPIQYVKLVHEGVVHSWDLCD